MDNNEEYTLYTNGSFGQIYINKTNSIVKKVTKVYENDKSLHNQNMIEATVSSILKNNSLQYIGEVFDVKIDNADEYNREYNIYMKYYPSVFFLGCNLNELYRYTYQILIGLGQLHSIVKCHGDLTPCNIMLDEKDNIRIIDFSSSMLENFPYVSNSPGCCRIYAAPELFIGYYSIKEVDRYHIGPFNDVWSLGMIILEMLLGYHPFELADGENFESSENIDWILNGNEQLFNTIIKKCIKNCESVSLPNYSKLWKGAWYDIIKDMLTVDHTKRPDINTLLSKYWSVNDIPSTISPKYYVSSKKIKFFDSSIIEHRDKLLFDFINNSKEVDYIFIPSTIMMYDYLLSDIKYTILFKRFTSEEILTSCLMINKSLHHFEPSVIENYKEECLFDILNISNMDIYFISLSSFWEQFRFHIKDMKYILEECVTWYTKLNWNNESFTLTVRDIVYIQERSYKRYIEKKSKHLC